MLLYTLHLDNFFFNIQNVIDLGIRSMFDPVKANLSGMLKPNIQWKIYEGKYHFKYVFQSFVLL